MKAVINAGGKGTRIASINNSVPKPMICIQGKPVLEHIIHNLSDNGFKDIIITVSHMADVIVNHFGDGSDFGVRISYFYEKEQLGTAGALFKIKEQLTEDFLLLNSDIMFDVDFDRFINFHKRKKGLATLFTHPNSHPYDSSLIISDDSNSVVTWLAKEVQRPPYYKNRVNAGLHIISPSLLERKIDSEKIDLDRQLLKPLASSNLLYSYDSPEYVKDMGTPERFYSVKKDFEDGIIFKKNLKRKQKAIFLDRDGTVNEHVGFLKNIDQLRLFSDVPDAIKKINSSEYLTIIVTNQPVIARGEVTIEELNNIHNKMETLLGYSGAYIDGLYYCPHHPDKGFEGERKEYKIECNCRKPKPGMLLKAADEYNIDLSDSWMIGDSKNDILCGKNAGCKTGYIGKEADFDCTLKGESLKAIIDKIL